MFLALVYPGKIFSKMVIFLRKLLISEYAKVIYFWLGALSKLRTTTVSQSFPREIFKEIWNGSVASFRRVRWVPLVDLGTMILQFPENTVIYRELVWLYHEGPGHRPPGGYWWRTCWFRSTLPPGCCMACISIIVTTHYAWWTGQLPRLPLCPQDEWVTSLKTSGI